MTENTEIKGFPDVQQLQAWKEKYGKVYILETEDPDSKEELRIVARKPSRATFERYQEELMKKGPKAMKNFVLDSVLYPARDELAKLLDEKPGFCSSLADPLQTQLGVGANFTINEF